ncbi:hypothetical protein [Acidithiobacillus caldus]|uniref:Uncharacterized protein n=1 Tax=Acidithiobacillus caldus TaxID=33059 RepID=A0A1E7Z091_9PROT|nr:hypothetical protein [Acidithiobacillus caldus]OFC35542.1 hypothetical protein BAE29_15435 [Acidithiobacillus caldus]OFC36391.1 hypothetical protein BAE27_06335 [Acidithiobacillus caldus]OFC40457.1 hypothetical protein BAE28_00155 [Acidithiobacillus caldus]OFC62171.1 hypothetical protein BAE30_02755 [Acidithiobacillus caldus]
MGRRKRRTEPLVVLHDSGYPGAEPEVGSALRSSPLTAMTRPAPVRIEDVGRWEIDIDAADAEVQGVRIYIPNTPVTSRAFFPYPMHLDTASVQKVAMRWLNRLMDMHYTSTLLQRLAIQRKQERLSREIGDALAGMQRAYRELSLWAQHEKAELIEHSGLARLNGTAAQVQFTGALNFVAALSSPQDRYLVQLLNAIDQLVGAYDRASLLCAFSQEEYVDGTRDALFRLESLLSEQGRLLRAKMNQWTVESADPREKETAGS